MNSTRPSATVQGPTLESCDASEKGPLLPRRIHQGFSVGRVSFLAMMRAWQDIGIDQLMINFRRSRRPVAEVFDELAEHVLPHFPPWRSGARGEHRRTVERTGP
ncbi:hypothetical protein [Streptomyces naphthomycinicus]|uniref:hypothetical protein n=1 Tax=Streptomyces naphthomycinicus TaxID=2872625 RepID=UPI001CEC48F5|nr:hypothetical protein [Streptomyces sp. TML10]